MIPPVEQPIFFVGMPRSGTTVIFEVFAARRDVAWLSQHLARAPGVPALAVLSRVTDLAPTTRRAIGRSDQSRRWLEKLKVGPSEAYEFWRRCCGEKFLYDYLLEVDATAAEIRCVRSTMAKVQRYQGKTRVAAKITGPGRIAYLSSIFPDARFVHVIRDGRAVSQSLMKVAFWRERGRMGRPAWANGLVAADWADWESHDRSPLALAAIQWRRVLESTRGEAARAAKGRYAEVNYERFVAAPRDVLGGIASFAKLPRSPEAEEFLKARVELRDMNFQWQQQLQTDQIDMLNQLLSRTLAEFGYEIEPPRSPAGGSAVSMPFTS